MVLAKECIREELDEWSKVWIRCLDVLEYIDISVTNHGWQSLIGTVQMLDLKENNQHQMITSKCVLHLHHSCN